NLPCNPYIVFTGHNYVQPAISGCILELHREANTMKDTLGKALRLGLLATLAGGTVLAQSPPPTPDPAKTQPPSEQTQAGQQAPVQQKDTVNPKSSKEDVEAIGNRSVGKGINLYSLEREIALGKGLAQEVERSSKLIDDPVVTEYVNRVGQNLVRNSD